MAGVSPRRPVLAASLVGVTAFLPFLRGAWLGRAFYFRDLAGYFFPCRRFVLEALAHGEVPYWNPLLHEGEPLSLPPVSYPLDLLQLLRPTEAGMSLLLALHVPLGALAFLALARGLGSTLAAAAGGALVYALGGFFLSTLNLYVYAQAAAWAPLVLLATLRAADRGGRSVVAASACLAVAVSTTGVELVLQTLLMAVVLAAPYDLRRLVRIATSVVLGLGLAAPTILLMRGLVADSARGAGFPVEVTLAQSLHPLTLVQVLVANWHGDLARIPNQWWGSNFFPQGFPYFVSLYLGAPVLAVAAAGAVSGSGPRTRLALLAGLGLAVALAPPGSTLILRLLPALRAIRFPSKAYFTFHFAAALLAALGLDRLCRADVRAWRLFGAVAGSLGGLLVAARLLPALAPGATRWFLEGFLPPSYGWPLRLSVGRLILSDAALGGGLALALSLLAVAVWRRAVAPERGAIAVIAVLAADLLRTGAGLNPMAEPESFRLSPEMTRVAADLRASGGRVFSCAPESQRSYFEARRLHPEHGVWSFAVLAETLTPDFNMAANVPTALSRDLTMLVPENRVLAPEQLGPRAFASVADRVLGAGVDHVLCLEELSHPALHLSETAAPARIAPLQVRVYDVTAPLPLRVLAREVRPVRDRAEAEGVARTPGFALAGGTAVEGGIAVAGATGSVVRVAEGADRIELLVEASGPSVVVVRDAFAPGWSASVDGRPAPVLRADGRHRAVPVPAGRSRVVLTYRPRGLRTGLAVAALSALVVGLLCVTRARPSVPAPGGRR